MGTLIRTPPIRIDDLPGSRTSHQIDTSDVLHVHRVSSCDERRVTIDILPDDVLLLVFRFDRLIFLDGLEDDEQLRPSSGWRWHRLVQVSRRWRSVVFALPIFLDLKLVCLPKTRAELTSIWPPLPIIIRNSLMWSLPEDYDFHAAIVHPNRVCKIDLYLNDRELQRLASSMQGPFPALTQLSLHFDPAHSLGPALALPDEFLGGSGSHLRHLELDGVPFPGLPKLLLSATHLVTLCLQHIPRCTYISPEVLVRCLSVLTSLESLALGVDSDDELSDHDQELNDESPDQESRRPRPPARSVLPALTHFKFTGIIEYLQDLVARIDAPRLFHFSITFSTPIDFDTPHLVQFIGRTPSLQAPDEACVIFGSINVRVKLSSRASGNGMLDVEFPGDSVNEQLSSVVRVCTSSLFLLSTIENLYISAGQFYVVYGQDDAINVLWQEFLRPFASVKNLYVSRALVPRTVSALQQLVGGRTTEVLPILQNLLSEGPQLSGLSQTIIQLKQFVAARQLSGNSIIVSIWDRDPEKDKL